MEFYKVHGLANDFLVIDAVKEADYGSLAVAACARHTGIGADGLLVLDRARVPEADFSLRFFNSDGSEAEMSGNGVRCAAAVLYYTGRANGPWLRFATLAGIKTLTLSARDGIRFDFEVVIGKPGFKPDEIPMIVSDNLERVLQYPLDVDGKKVEITAVSTGNPHCTVFVDDFDKVDWRTLGAKLESHPAFPKRTNVEFVRVVLPAEIETRFWERGVGETQSSGTGSCGAAVAAMINGFTERRVLVNMPAGQLTVEWCDDEVIVFTGPTEIICHGRYLVH
jgi:diaminopimelate epimerase